MYGNYGVYINPLGRSGLVVCGRKGLMMNSLFSYFGGGGFQEEHHVQYLGTRGIQLKVFPFMHIEEQCGFN